MPTTLKEYLEQVSINWIESKDHQRVGQIYFNTLSVMDSELARSVTGTSVDPFYDDAQLPFFLSWLTQELE
jgi:hypothetical protein